MKRKLAALLLVLSLFAFAQAEQADVIVLIDSSESLFPYFDSVIEYVKKSVVTDFVREGDTFHILTFAETSQLELSQAVTGEADLRAIVTRLYLLYPLGKHTDLASSLNYLYQYASDLAERPKSVIIITDGIHNPADTSPYAGKSAQEIGDIVKDSIQKMRTRGWKVSYIRVPFVDTDPTGAKVEDGTSIDLSETLFSELKDSSVVFDATKPELMNQSILSLPTAVFPVDLGKKDSRFSLPVKVSNSTNKDARFELVGVIMAPGSVDILEKHVFLSLDKGKNGVLRIPLSLPDSIPDGQVELSIRLDFDGDSRLSPSSGVVKLDLKRSAAASFVRASMPVFLFALVIVAAIGVIVLIILLVRNAPTRSGKAFAGAGKPSEADQERQPQEFASASAAAAARQSRENLRAPSKPVEVQEPITAASEKYAAPAAELLQYQGKKASELAAQQGLPPPIDRADAAASRPATDQRAAELAASLAQEKGQGPTDIEARALLLAKDNALNLADRDAANRAAVAAAGAGYLISDLDLKTDADAESRKRAAEAALERESEREAEALIRSMKVKKEGRIQVQLHVSQQNPHIGLRNVHSMKAGAKLSIGGWTNADFRIFVVKVPRRLADLYFDGETLTFIPVRKDYFPALSGPVADCLDSPLECVTPEGFKTLITVTRWENPVEAFNRLLERIDMGPMFAAREKRLDPSDSEL
jgi:hypothetical protein